MTTPDMFKVVTTVIPPGYGDGNPRPVGEKVLSLEELSAQYPRARAHGSLVLARYDYETGIYDSERYEERIEPVAEGAKLDEDPRIFDDELDPSVLPEGYQIGEGYAQWQARTTPMVAWYEGVKNTVRLSMAPAPTLKEEVTRKIFTWLETSSTMAKIAAASDRRHAERTRKYNEEIDRLDREV